jgi:hypothetical protein
LVLTAVIAYAAAGGPVDAATSSLVNYILGYGILGVAVLAFMVGLIVPRKALSDARKEAREDLERENGRLIEQNRILAEQRDDAVKIAQTQVVPLLTSFNATMTALLPLLQRLVAEQEAYGPASRRRG